MSAEQCTSCMAAEGTQAILPQSIAAQIEQLRLERIRQFADVAFVSSSRRQSDLERSVDTLLDSFSTMYQLDNIASHVARGGQIVTDADRLLVAENQETYLKLLANHQDDASMGASGINPFLQAMPVPAT